MNQEIAGTGMTLVKFDPTRDYSEAKLEFSTLVPNMQWPKMQIKWNEYVKAI